MAPLSCIHCSRSFQSEHALEQHVNARHAYMCNPCNRSFRSQHALEQHTNAVHANNFECNYCDRIFRSEHALERHTASNHPLEPDVYTGVPFEGAIGCWVYRHECDDYKGFGVFRCSSCLRIWMSAHAYRKKYNQDCQRCNISVAPYIMWIFEEEPEEHESNDKPHDASRCDACRAGDYCTTSRPSDDYSRNTASQPSVPSTLRTSTRPSVPSTLTTSTWPSVPSTLTTSTRPSVPSTLTTSTRPSVPSTFTTSTRTPAHVAAPRDSPTMCIII